MKTIETYNKALRHLARFTDYERMTKYHYSQKTFNLKRMERLLAGLGNPHHRLCAIHIAGTKGKGSTAIILSQILQAAGYKVGLFTSPHLVDIRERIQVNGVNITKDNFTRLMNIIADNAGHLKPTFFEIITAMAFLYFAEQNVNFAVVEVGLGGRLDATNIITPLASVITRIDFDHMDKLGNTIGKIASEKAGIIKENVSVITLSQSYPIADRVIKQRARMKKAPLYIIRSLARPPAGWKVLGRHQPENLALALAALKALNIHINRNIISRALEKLRLPGRLEIVSRWPYVVIDSAHNPVSMKAAVDTISREVKYRRLILILGISCDKEIAEILDIIIPLADVVILTGTDNPRLLKPIEFLDYIKEEHLERPIFLEPDYRRAYRLARKLAGQSDLILATGSFYLAGAMLGLHRIILSNMGYRRNLKWAVLTPDP
ncbi:MAG: bifunctional folylpolyglutamate synthase/dihydrofolate synthase [Planctomycetes bacterium]|nr:bifunctional folylpolyglutamate synthase/dihydrofolate synthase [Planctomycetota bacterium]